MAASRSLALALAYTLCLTLLLITASTPALLVQGHPHSKWVNHGGGILNHRSAIGKITAKNVQNLTLAWRFPTGFPVSATPSISDGAIYFPGWNGMLYSLKEDTGALRWIANLTDLMGADVDTPPAVSRATPVVTSGGLLLVGIYGPAVVLALNRHDGTLVWRSQRLDHTLNAVITMSGTTYRGHYYVGVSSVEEALEECCSFQGSFQKLSLKDGHVVWKTSMLPPNSGYYGVAVWGSSPSIDVKRRLVFIATGNNYRVPQSVEDCELNRTISNRTKTEPDQCLDRSDHQDSMLALNIDDGSIAWSANFQEYDVWTIPCQGNSSSPNCPAILGPDYDFGEAPMLLHLDQHGHPTASGSEKCLVVAGQKSGVVWALDCDTGSTVWSTAAGPGGTLGGASWGSSFDGDHVYTNIANFGRSNFTLAPSQRVTRGGGWVAMDAHTGRVIWSTAEPKETYAFGPVSSAKGVVFGTSFSSPGYVYALDAVNGSILWSAALGGSVYGGVSIGHTCIFVGDGYRYSFTENPSDPPPKGTSVSAFCL